MTRTTTEPARFSKAALFRRIGYEPHVGQVLVHRSRAPRRILASGSRWGKTRCAAHEAIAAMLEPRERSIGWIVAPSYDLADRVFRMVVEIVQTQFGHRIRTLSERDQRIVLTNFGGGVSEARGKSADRPASLLGEGLDWLVVDEAAQLDREVWDQYLSQRLVDRHGWALLISTPKGAGWFFRIYRRGQLRKDADYESWSSPSTANPHLDAVAIEGERSRIPDQVFRQEYLGEFVGTQTDPCDLCGGPKRFAPGFVYLDHDGDPPHCPDCDQVVDKCGRTLVALRPDGSVQMKIVRKSEGAWPFPVPEESVLPEMLTNASAAQLGSDMEPECDHSPEDVELATGEEPVPALPKAE